MRRLLRPLHLGDTVAMSRLARCVAVGLLAAAGLGACSGADEPSTATTSTTAFDLAAFDAACVDHGGTIDAAREPAKQRCTPSDASTTTVLRAPDVKDVCIYANGGPAGVQNDALNGELGAEAVAFESLRFQNFSKLSKDDADAHVWAAAERACPGPGLENVRTHWQARLNAADG
jgi:hypothetical protein